MMSTLVFIKGLVTRRVLRAPSKDPFLRPHKKPFPNPLRTSINRFTPQSPLLFWRFLRWIETSAMGIGRDVAVVGRGMVFIGGCRTYGVCGWVLWTEYKFLCDKKGMVLQEKEREREKERVSSKEFLR